MRSAVLDYDTPSGRIIYYLQRHGSASVKELREALGVTTNAVRQQLMQLQAEGIITAKLHRKGVGRPFYVYYMTEEAKDILANRTGDLLVSVYKKVVENPESELARGFFSQMEEELVREYEAASAGVSGIRAKLEAIVRHFKAEGLQVELEEDEHGLVLLFFTCPYYSLAKEDSNKTICHVSRKALSEVLGVPVERGQCGEKGMFCCFRITSA
jgi:DeoR family suf operon transcriptional repressor